KGPVIQTAIIAGTMAVKKTAELIPFCHTLPIQSCKFATELQIVENTLELTLRCTVKTCYKTGVEMEALCGVSVAALTVYDMAKALSPDIAIAATRLLAKTGGKSDFSRRPLYGLVLTGGKSQRMGRDKALLDYRGQPHAQYLYELLTPLCDQVFLSSRPQQWQGTGLDALPQLVDQGESRGPFSGIFTALTTHPQVNWLVVACDLAYLEAQSLQTLVNQAKQDAVATCYRHVEKGFPEALCGIYTPLALPLFKKAHQAGIYCPVKILQMGNCHLIDPETDRPLTNINTPEAYAQARHP
ncbi:MAG: molybdenum cofactor biosynthesis protein, partial [Cyanobacteriota bacterium]